MPLWLWVIIIVALVFLVIDWFIVMGADPKQWKGGERKR